MIPYVVRLEFDDSFAWQYSTSCFGDGWEHGDGEGDSYVDGAGLWRSDSGSECVYYEGGREDECNGGGAPSWY